MSVMCLMANAQLVGRFQKFNDGHIYFVAENVSYNNYRVTINAVSTDRNNSEVKVVTARGGFYLGPTTPWRWYWKKGDTIRVVYDNGYSQVWTCPTTDPAYYRLQLSNDTYIEGTAASR